MKILRFFEGLFLGAILGGVIAIMLTPESGEDLRHRLQSEAERIQQEVKKAARERRMELEQQLSAMRKPQKT